MADGRPDNHEKGTRHVRKSWIPRYDPRMLPRRALERSVRNALARSRAVILAGPRQCGKTTLAKTLVDRSSPNYFDLAEIASAAGEYRIPTPRACGCAADFRAPTSPRRTKTAWHGAVMPSPATSKSTCRNSASTLPICAVLSDQVKSLGWKVRRAKKKAVVSADVLVHVRAKMKALLQIP